MPDHALPSIPLAELPGRLGEVLGTSPWLTIDQARIDAFARATEDLQWIHTDPARAAAGPFGATIAHGFLTLSLLPRFFESSIAVTESAMGVNYGLNKVRFMAPVPVGSRLRARLMLQTVEPVAPDGVQMNWLVTVEREGSDKPVCVAESLVRNYGAPA